MGRKYLSLAWFVFSLAAVEQAVKGLKIEVIKDQKRIEVYTDSNAQFERRSANIPTSGPTTGQLMYAVPRNACMTVQDVPRNESWFAFIEEYGTCPDVQPGNLYNAGFSMMIAATAYSNVELNSPSQLPQALITSTEFRDFLNNTAIVGYSANASTVYIKVTEDSLLMYYKLFIIFGIVLFAAVVFSVLIFCCSLCCRIVIYKWRTRGLTRWRVRQLPKRRYHKDSETCETCSICLEDFKEGEQIRVLPCDHVFHPKCVDEWLQKWNRTCPLCKSTIQRRIGRTEHPAPASTSEQEEARLLPNEEQEESYGATGYSSPLTETVESRVVESSIASDFSDSSGPIPRSTSRSMTMATVELSSTPPASPVFHTPPPSDARGDPAPTNLVEKPNTTVRV